MLVERKERRQIILTVTPGCTWFSALFHSSGIRGKAMGLFNRTVNLAVFRKEQLILFSNSLLEKNYFGGQKLFLSSLEFQSALSFYNVTYYIFIVIMVLTADC